MSRTEARARRGTLVIISILCFGAGVAILYAGSAADLLARASTAQLASLLGLLVLPWATLVVRRLDREARRRRAVARAV